jgi:chemotaxis protein MotB
MRSYSSGREGDDINPYIALSDIAISVVLIVVFFVALDRLSLANFKYKKSMADFSQAVNHDLPLAVRPRWEHGRNDPPGVQRWVFDGRSIFLPANPADPDAKPKLSPDGQRVFIDFGKILHKYRASWRRIRVEGHTKPPDPNAPDDWDLSARRAGVVVEQLETGGQIQPWFFAVSGRAGQNPLHSVFVCAHPGSASSQGIENVLRTHGVTFAEKDLSKDLSLDPAVKEAVPLMRRDGTPYIVEVNDDGVQSVFPARDDPKNNSKLLGLINRFSQNERVEVCIEYISKGNNGSS